MTPWLLFLFLCYWVYMLDPAASWSRARQLQQSPCQWATRFNRTQQCRPMDQMGNEKRAGSQFRNSHQLQLRVQQRLSLLSRQQLTIPCEKFASQDEYCPTQNMSISQFLTTVPCDCAMRVSDANAASWHLHNQMKWLSFKPFIIFSKQK